MDRPDGPGWLQRKAHISPYERPAEELGPWMMSLSQASTTASKADLWTKAELGNDGLMLRGAQTGGGPRETRHHGLSIQDPLHGQS